MEREVVGRGPADPASSSSVLGAWTSVVGQNWKWVSSGVEARWRR